jgi:adenylosuccinate lyase
MTGGELALVVAVVLCALAFAALVLVLARVLQALRALDASAEEIRRAVADTGPLLAELRASVDHARADLDRFDAVLGSAEAISTHVEGASRVARAALSRPVIKTVALASGTQRAARRLRRPER